MCFLRSLRLYATVDYDLNKIKMSAVKITRVNGNAYAQHTSSKLHSFGSSAAAAYGYKYDADSHGEAEEVLSHQVEQHRVDPERVESTRG